MILARILQSCQNLRYVNSGPFLEGDLPKQNVNLNIVVGFVDLWMGTDYNPWVDSAN